MSEYRLQLWRKIPDTNTRWTPVIEVEFTEQSDDGAVADTTGAIPEDNITRQRRRA